MEELKQKIQELAHEKNAVIFAHYYTRPEIQEIADFIGDSLALAQQATRVHISSANFRAFPFLPV